MILVYGLINSCSKFILNILFNINTFNTSQAERVITEISTENILTLVDILSKYTLTIIKAIILINVFTPKLIGNNFEPYVINEQIRTALKHNLFEIFLLANMQTIAIIKNDSGTILKSKSQTDNLNI